MTKFTALTECQEAEGHSFLRLQTYACEMRTDKLARAGVKSPMRETNIKQTLALGAGI
jgi:hypothetical protein